MLNIQQYKDDFEEQNIPANLKQLKKRVKFRSGNQAELIAQVKVQEEKKKLCIACRNDSAK